MTDDLAIEVKDLTRTFGPKNDEKIAVDGISFEVKKGEIFGILGPNGAGKTTTIKMLSTLLLPTSGKAIVLGYDVSSDRNKRDLRMRINVVSGGERGLYYRLTGRQNLYYFADLYNIPRKVQKEKVKDLLELVGLTDAADKRVEEYSRGMKQRIHIARALINDPEVLFLDEPTIGLDPEISKEIRAIVKRLSSEGTTVILTTHYMAEAEELCDRMIIMTHGTIVGYGSVPELKSKVSEADMIRVVTTNDPSDVIKSIENDERIESIRTDVVTGRYEVSIRIRKGTDMISQVEDAFRKVDVRSIGYDEPTMEDTYLHLVGGDSE